MIAAMYLTSRALVNCAQEHAAGSLRPPVVKLCSQIAAPQDDTAPSFPRHQHPLEHPLHAPSRLSDDSTIIRMNKSWI